MRDILAKSILGAMPDEEKVHLTDYIKPEKDYESRKDGGREKVDEDKELIEVGKGVLLTKKEVEWWRKSIIYVSLATIVPLTILAFTFLAVSFYASSAAALSLSFDMILDAASSVVVVWRFYGNSDTCGCPDKEKRTIVLFAFLFIAFGLIILVKGIVSLIAQVVMSGLMILTILSTVGAVVTTVLVTIKLIIARKLNSQTMYCDAFSSGMGAITGFSILVSTIVYAKTGFWCLDGIVAIAVAVAMIIWGIWLLIKNVNLCGSKKKEAHTGGTV